jgi:hypothetical protein
MTTTSNGF